MAANIYKVNENTPIAHALGWIAEYSRRSGGLTDLFVMCHGFEGNLDLRNVRCTTEVHGGFGLQLCDDGLSLSNASKTSVLSRKVTKDHDLLVRYSRHRALQHGDRRRRHALLRRDRSLDRCGGNRGRADTTLQQDPNFLATGREFQPGWHHRFRRMGGSGVYLLARQSIREKDQHVVAASHAAPETARRRRITAPSRTPAGAERGGVFPERSFWYDLASRPARERSAGA